MPALTAPASSRRPLPSLPFLTPLLLVALAGTMLASPRPTSALGEGTILTESSPWRYFPVWRTAVYRDGDDGIETNWRWTRRIQPTPPPPARWLEVDFDDGGWTRMRGPLFDGRRGEAGVGGHGQDEPVTIANIHLRGRFLVDEPAAVDRLKLTLAYRGGVAVYLNGHEVGRWDLPDGRLEATTLARDYPLSAARPDPRHNPDASGQARDSRLRRARDVAIPTDLLRRGVNVLALRLHRAPYPEEAMEKHTRLASWATVGLHALDLSAAPADAVEPNTAHPAHTQVWTADPTADLADDVACGERIAWGDAAELAAGIRPIRMIALRNGTVNGQAVVSAPRPIEAVTATLGDARTTGGAALPADAWRVRYAAKTTPQSRFTAPRFDVLLDAYPGGQSMVPIWVSARVPADAEPGLYRTTLRVRADGLDEPVDVPIELTVIDWLLPEPQQWSSFVSIDHSPHAVAWQYGVEMWSQRHFELMKPSMELMARLGNNVAWIDIIHPTFFANEHGMIVFEREDGERMVPDFRYFDRFLDAYARHVGEPKKLVLYVWEPHLEPGRGEPAATVTLTERRPDGSLAHFSHPMYGREGSHELWQAVMDGVRQRMRQRGWSERIVVLGTGHDRRPSQQTVGFFKQVAPWAKWAIFTHGRGDPRIRDDRLTIGQMEVGYLEYPYHHGRAGQRSRTMLGGWKDLDANIHKVYCGRGTMNEYSPLHNFRSYGDVSVTGSSNGFGRLGMDLWPVQRPGAGGQGEARRPVHGVGGWGNLYRGNPRSIAYPGPDGAVASIRFELLREGLQEAEARIFIEKALADEATAAILGDDIAQRYNDLSTERLAHRNGEGHQLLVLGPNWKDRLQALYELAAEIRHLKATATATAPAAEPEPGPRPR